MMKPYMLLFVFKPEASMLSVLPLINYSPLVFKYKIKSTKSHV